MNERANPFKNATEETVRALCDERDQLRAERDALKAETKDTNALFVKHSREYQAEIDRLKQALAVAKERLSEIADKTEFPDLDAKEALAEIEKLEGEEQKK